VFAIALKKEKKEKKSNFYYGGRFKQHLAYIFSHETSNVQY